MRFHRSCYNDEGVLIWARKSKRRKHRFIKGAQGHVGRTKDTQRAENRRTRREPIT